MEILFVCTGNICRSPMAEALFRARAADHGLSVNASSAGLLFDGRGAEPRAIETMDRLGLDISGHSSRVMDGQMIRGADLVIGMEQRHVREAATLDLAAFGRTFTLPDLVERGEAEGPRGAGEPFDDWVLRIGVGRTRADILRARAMSEVPDPIGRSKRRFRASAESMAALLDRLMLLAWPGTVPSGQHDLADPLPPTPRSL